MRLVRLRLASLALTVVAACSAEPSAPASEASPAGRRVLQNFLEQVVAP